MRANYYLKSFVAICFLFAGATLHSAKADQPSAVISSHVPQAELVGSGTLSYMVWNVYDAALYAPNGDFNADDNFALSIHYLRPLEGAKIVKHTVRAIEKMGFADKALLSNWGDQLLSFMPDVDDGVVITGIRAQSGETLFYQHDKLIGTISDSEFGRWFFDIWLGENSQRPELRQALLAL